MILFCTIRVGNWMVRDWHLYRYVQIRFGQRQQYTRHDWRRVL